MAFRSPLPYNTQKRYKGRSTCGRQQSEQTHQFSPKYTATFTALQLFYLSIRAGRNYGRSSKPSPTSSVCVAPASKRSRREAALRGVSATQNYISRLFHDAFSGARFKTFLYVVALFPFEKFMQVANGTTLVLPSGKATRYYRMKDR